MSATDFNGLPTRIIGNRHLRLEFLANAGPRIVRLMLNDTNENLFAQALDARWVTPFGEYYARGGHRLWHAPEAMPRSYIPDNDGLVIEELANGVRLTQPTEVFTGIGKSIEIQLHEDAPRATVVHRLKNQGARTMELAPWAITMLRLGGIAILPQRVRSLDANRLLPSRNLVLWSYASWNDARLEIADDYVLIRAQSLPAPFKIGYLNRVGWIAYLWNGVLFVKRVESQPRSTHPDLNCNAEVYCNDRYIELETLAPLCRLQPGETVTHVETWELYAGVGAIQTPADIPRLLCECGFAKPTEQP